MSVRHPVMVVEDHDGCHTAGGDHEHDGREVSPCKVNTEMCNEKKNVTKKWLTDTAKINALGVGSTYWLAACILHRELCKKILILKVLKLDKMKQFFPRNSNNHAMEVSSSESYKVARSHTERFRKSAIPSMIKMLNDCQRQKKETLKKLDAMPVNHVCFSLYHCDNNKL